MRKYGVALNHTVWVGSICLISKTGQKYHYFNEFDQDTKMFTILRDLAEGYKWIKENHFVKNV